MISFISRVFFIHGHTHDCGQGDHAIKIETKPDGQPSLQSTSVRTAYFRASRKTASTWLQHHLDARRMQHGLEGSIGIVWLLRLWPWLGLPPLCFSFSSPSLPLVSSLPFFSFPFYFSFLIFLQSFLNLPLYSQSLISVLHCSGKEESWEVVGTTSSMSSCAEGLPTVTALTFPWICLPGT